jgi:hypothetical protein
MADNNTAGAAAASEIQETDIEASTPRQNRMKDIYAHPWTQIIAISVICFCCPGV